MFDVGANVDNPLLQEVLLETMKKQLTSQKPHRKTSATWAFFKVNDNQDVDLKQSQIMHCIVRHNEAVGFKILALCTRFRKDLITYNKACMIFGILKLIPEKP